MARGAIVAVRARRSWRLRAWLRIARLRVLPVALRAWCVGRAERSLRVEVQRADGTWGPIRARRGGGRA